MKIQFRALPVSKRLNGWKQIIRRVQSVLRGTLVINFGPITEEPAN